MKPPNEIDHYEVLEVTRDASAEEIERAYRLALATYTEGSLALYSILDEREAAAERERVEAAYRVLSDSGARRQYDASLEAGAEGGTGELPSAPEPDAFDEGPGDDEMIPLEVREAREEEPWNGLRLRRSRLLQGLELDEIARVTKVNATYLRFVEDERFDDLPAAVYVRGFVVAYARLLGLDGARVAASYMERYEVQQEVGGHGR